MAYLVSRNVPLHRDIAYTIETLKELIPESNFIITGGAARDMFLNGPCNDIDIAYNDNNFSRKMSNTFELRNIYGTMKYVLLDRITRSICGDIMSMQTYCYEYLYPAKFDYTINQIIVTPNGKVLASDRTWFDIDNRILRLNPLSKPDYSSLLRACRFIATFDLVVEDYTYRLLESLMFGLNEAVLLRQLLRAQDNDVLDKTLEVMHSFGVPFPYHTSNQDLIDRLCNVVDFTSIKKYNEEDW